VCFQDIFVYCTSVALDWGLIVFMAIEGLGCSDTCNKFICILFWYIGTGYVCCTCVTFEYLLVCICEISKQGML
jgi:hypothetical protein